MTALETEMFKAIHGWDFPTDPEIAGLDYNQELLKNASNAAEVAKRYVDKAYDAGMARSYDIVNNAVQKEPKYDQWLKENGITE
jgi:hypothetical protein